MKEGKTFLERPLRAERLPLGWDPEPDRREEEGGGEQVCRGGPLAPAGMPARVPGAQVGQALQRPPSGVQWGLGSQRGASVEEES